MQKNYLIVGGIAVVIVVAVAGFFLLRSGGDEHPVEPPAGVEAPPAATPTPGLQARLSERLKGTTLATADEVLSGLAAEVSSHPKLAEWLANEDMLRRFVAAVDNTAAGKNPRTHFEFLRPQQPFEVVEKGNAYTVDPASWARYDLIADVFVSLDSRGVTALYRELEPLLDEAYREIAPPDRNFRQRLDQAIEQLLAAPVPDPETKLERKVVTYVYADPKLEKLSPAQRQLLRMGPDNVRRIQDKLRQLQQALDAADEPAAAE